ncbi:MAG TPA: D-cysteine desulfhydrase family protein [Bacteroidota bacterium]|nr:D-cysteine desulfhydrase family protein [Bacteroidota bacterium]
MITSDDPAPSPDDCLSRIPRVLLADLPTPLQEVPRLSRTIGFTRLLVKRDDQTGLAMGGNKARKLEYDFAPILKEGSDVVLTVGGAQSNHAVMTAAAARRTGLDAKIVLGGPGPVAYQGNLLLDVLFGAEIRYLKDDDRNDHLASAMDEWADSLRREGRRVSTIPVGGSTGLGALGYVRAMKELAGQLGPGASQIVMAVGSCGTLAGAILGARLYMPEARVIGISVSRTSAEIARRTVEIVRESAQLLQCEVSLGESSVESYDCYHHEYGVQTESGKDAILSCARLEGILLDPVYTGKSMAGLLDLARRRILDPGIPTVFIHTGGLPILFAFEPGFRDLARCTTLSFQPRKDLE